MPSSLILPNNSEPFFNWIMTCDAKWILYNNQQWSGQCLDQEAPKHFPKPSLHQKKGSESLFGGLLLVCSIQLPESQWNHYIWEVCSANRWDALKTATPAAGTGQQKGPNSSPQQCPTTCCTTNRNWRSEIFCTIRKNCLPRHRKGQHDLLSDYSQECFCMLFSAKVMFYKLI